MARIYKEGQGKWSRGVLVGVIILAAFLALEQLHRAMPVGERVRLPFIGFELDYRFLVHAPLLIAAFYVAYWLFNRPRTADFLVDTENELKNKVTWPSRKEEISSSIVVVVTVLVLGIFIFAVDWAFRFLSSLFYGVET